jgi:oligoendopeptidase F
MAVVDAFQHWLYTQPHDKVDSTALDAEWNALWQRFLPGVDWRGLDEVRASGWQRKLHIFRAPFYYIEYGMAQIGALQIWRNSLHDHQQALSDYRRALALGGTRPLPELFEAAGAEFRFDKTLLAELVDLLETTLEQLETEMEAALVS